MCSSSSNRCGRVRNRLQECLLVLIFLSVCTQARSVKSSSRFLTLPCFVWRSELNSLTESSRNYVSWNRRLAVMWCFEKVHCTINIYQPGWSFNIIMPATFRMYISIHNHKQDARKIPFTFRKHSQAQARCSDNTVHIWSLYQHSHHKQDGATMYFLNLSTSIHRYKTSNPLQFEIDITKKFDLSFMVVSGTGCSTSENTVRLRSPYQHSRPNEVVFGCHCDQLRVQWVSYYSPTPSAFPEFNEYPITAPHLVLSPSTSGTLIQSHP